MLKLEFVGFARLILCLFFFSMSPTLELVKFQPSHAWFICCILNQTIPSKFCSGHLPNDKAELVLRLAGCEETWLVNYINRSYQQELHFKKFSQDNNLRQGDVCLFELVKGAKPTTFNIHISRIKKKDVWL